MSIFFSVEKWGTEVNLSTRACRFENRDGGWDVYENFGKMLSGLIRFLGNREKVTGREEGG